jgi:hypothetical protein
MSEPAPNLWVVLIKVRLDMVTSQEHRRSILDERVAPQ